MKAPDSKSGLGAILTGVRIPPLPPPSCHIFTNRFVAEGYINFVFAHHDSFGVQVNCTDVDAPPDPKSPPKSLSTPGGTRCPPHRRRSARRLRVPGRKHRPLRAGLSMNLVAADVRRLTLNSSQLVRASLRRLLRGSWSQCMRKTKGDSPRISFCVVFGGLMWSPVVSLKRSGATGLSCLGGAGAPTTLGRSHALTLHA